MEPTVSSETSANRTQKPGNYPIRNKLHLEHGKSLKTRNEIMLSLLTEAPHLICLNERHLNNYETDATPICNYTLGAKYCRNKLKTGSVCIYIQEALKFTNISLQKHCKEQDIEITAVQLKLNKKNVIIFCVYRAPTEILITF